jgi:hypothetical protein
MKRAVLSIAIAAGAVLATAAPASASGPQLGSVTEVVLTPTTGILYNLTLLKLPLLTPKSVETVIVLPS